jgi:threonine dehydrogenase-like Zn-dependent dehydrogenase
MPCARVALLARTEAEQAAGGVGLSACQIAKAVGAKVIACASADKHEICKNHGYADYTVDFDKVRVICDGSRNTEAPRRRIGRRTSSRSQGARASMVSVCTGFQQC